MIEKRFYVTENIYEGYNDTEQLTNICYLIPCGNLEKKKKKFLSNKLCFTDNNFLWISKHLSFETSSVFVVINEKTNVSYF